AASAAILAEAPARFSMLTGWPSDCESFSPTRRAKMSVEPPGANGTTILTVFWGYFSCPSEFKDRKRQKSKTANRSIPKFYRTDRLGRRGAASRAIQAGRPRGGRRGGTYGASSPALPARAG